MERRLDNPGSITLRPMTHKDIPLGMRLKSVAGWNQLETDWEMLLDAASEGAFVAMVNGIDVGTVTTVTYERRFSWIGMLLVDPAFRRRGVGTALLNAAIGTVEKYGPVRLDATPEGRKLYATLGFKDEYRLARMQRMAAPLAEEPIVRCFEVTQETLSAIVHFDTPIFGAERETILGALLRYAPQYAYCVKKHEKVIGYCLGRSGSSFDQLGPIVAHDSETAQALMLTALKSCARKFVIVDTLLNRESWATFLSELGFVEQRPFVRMYLGELRHPGQPERQFAIAGPEIG
jgi:GNAT superfamily N-acetyltransferase